MGSWALATPRPPPAGCVRSRASRTLLLFLGGFVCGVRDCRPLLLRVRYGRNALRGYSLLTAAVRIVLENTHSHGRGENSSREYSKPGAVFLGLLTVTQREDRPIKYYRSATASWCAPAARRFAASLAGARPAPGHPDHLWPYIYLGTYQSAIAIHGMFTHAQQGGEGPTPDGQKLRWGLHTGRLHSTHL